MQSEDNIPGGLGNADNPVHNFCCSGARDADGYVPNILMWQLCFLSQRPISRTVFDDSTSLCVLCRGLKGHSCVKMICSNMNGADFKACLTKGV